MAHYDVVPADDDGWQHPPFAGTVADGRVHGRGALDDKGQLVTILESVENRLATGFAPAQDVYLSFGGNEEHFGTGARDHAAALHARGVRPWLVLDEGGAVVDSVFPGVSGRLAMIGVAEKGFATLRLEVTTAPGHAATPRGDDAVGRLVRAVRRVQRRPFPPRLSEPLIAMLEAISPHLPPPLRPVSGGIRALRRPLARVRRPGRRSLR